MLNDIKIPLFMLYLLVAAIALIAFGFTAYAALFGFIEFYYFPRALFGIAVDMAIFAVVAEYIRRH